MPDRYTFPGTEVLRNRFGISAALAAHELETRVAYQRLVDLSVRPIPGDFDLAHLQAMHQAIYGDLWDWAGQIRSVDTGTVNTGLAHCRPEFIREQAGIVFGELARDDFVRGMERVEFADRLAHYWGELTALHPFRDGNTRVQRLFFHQLTDEAGWSIDWVAINDQMTHFVKARLLAHAGWHEPFRDLLAPVLHRGSSNHPVGLEGPALREQIGHLRDGAVSRPDARDR